MPGPVSRAVRTTQTKFYLGDGVFVESRPDALVLTTEDGVAVTNTIVLESAVLVNLFNLLGVPLPAHLKEM